MAAKKQNLHFVLRNVGLLPASLSLYQQILYAVGIGRMSRRSRLVSSVSSLVVRAARTGVRLCERSHLVRRPVGKSRAAAVAGRSCNSLMRPAGVSISTASSETPRSVCRTSRPPRERFPMPFVQSFPRWGNLHNFRRGGSPPSPRSSTCVNHLNPSLPVAGTARD